MENGERFHRTVNIFSAVALIISAMTMSICISIRSEIRNGILQDDIKSEIPISNLDIDEIKYIAEIENGYVVVKSVSGEKISVLNVPIKLMSPEDREYFENGAYIYSDSELDELIDDFSS